MKCFRCGDCCKIHYILTEEELDLLPLTLDVIQIGKNRFKTIDNICPFLSSSSLFSLSQDSGSYKNNQPTKEVDNRRATNYCSIYNIRPCQCRLFHCGRINITDKKLDKILDIRELILNNPEYRKFKEDMDEEAIKWGNAHGWNWKKLNKIDKEVI